MPGELDRMQEQFGMMREQFDLLEQQFKIAYALNMLERFHAFDAIKDDGCPCCGARVEVAENGHGSGIRLRAVNG